MKPLGPAGRVYALCAPVDMRRGFEGLWALATQQMGHDVLAGDLFLFLGKDCRRAKVLFSTAPACVCCIKRLEQGRFACLWRSAHGPVLACPPPSCSCFWKAARLWASSAFPSGSVSPAAARGRRGQPLINRTSARVQSACTASPDLVSVVRAGRGSHQRPGPAAADCDAAESGTGAAASAHGAAGLAAGGAARGSPGPSSWSWLRSGCRNSWPRCSTGSSVPLRRSGLKAPRPRRRHPGLASATAPAQPQLARLESGMNFRRPIRTARCAADPSQR